MIAPLGEVTRQLAKELAVRALVRRDVRTTLEVTLAPGDAGGAVFLRQKGLKLAEKVGEFIMRYRTLDASECD